MMKKVLLVFLAVFILALASCSGAAADEGATGQSNDNNFEVKLFMDKASYSPSEQIICYATVEYTGEGDGITVYNYDPSLWFSIEGKGLYGRSEIGTLPVKTEYKKGVPVRYDFKDSNNWDTKYGEDLIYFDGEKLFLAGGDYKFYVYYKYFLVEDILAGIGHIIRVSITVSVQQFPTESIIAFIIIGLIVVIFSKWFRTSFKLKQMRSMRHLSDYEPTANHDPSFEEELKKAKLNPQKVITFGTNRLAIDSQKMKLFVRSSKAIDGVLLDYKDIVSYELIKDGKVIAQPGGLLTDSAAAAGEDGIICSDLRLVIKTKKASDPEVVLPFIAFSIDSEFAYKEALDAAKEAAEALDGMIR